MAGRNIHVQFLFGDYYDTYIGMLCVHYRIYKTDKDLAKYVKLHIDDGLELLNKEIEKAPNIDGFDFLSEKILLSI
ncbi:DndE family protein [Sphingobacterium sp. SG20118]|uniref:DndE family protein n=1 Tax=Sphingobacterium sp. SG20118 TaxID=3367156 RepID=UPI0037DFC8BA